MIVHIFIHLKYPAYYCLHSMNSCLPKHLRVTRNYMTTRRPTETLAQRLAGTAEAFHGKIAEDGPFKPEKDRYHMYIGLFCPFAHRANLVRHLKGLQDIIPISVVRPYPKGDETGWPGWKFPENDTEYPAATVDPLFGSEYLHEIYFKADGEYKGRYSVPCVWDKKTETIVNNESAELLRDWQTAFNSVIHPENAQVSLYPKHLRRRIDEIAEWLGRDLNTGVYKAGFAANQEDYDKNVLPVFAALNKMEKIIDENGGPFVLGKELTEVDIRLYCTAIRFDTVYVQHFKCNLGTIRHDYPQINNWMKNLYWNVKGFKETTNFKHIKENYTKSHYDINPKAITPRGPFPNIEDGFESDFSKIKVGSINIPAVLELEQKLP